MKSYLDIVQKVLTKGKWKKPVRQQADGSAIELDNDTLALPNQLFSHDMSDGFPLLTTKRMPINTILVELEGFIKGVTSKQWFKDRHCNIWNSWANPEKVFNEYKLREKSLSPYQTKQEVAAELDDLGPIYGYQWRDFNGAYGDDILTTEAHNIKGADQLKGIVDTLHNNPYDRRMVCSAWNPNQIDKMALPPCHYAWNVTVIDDEINLFWAQRSCDLMLGVPFNIASYATLLMLLAKESGFKPGNLSGMLVDCHIYRNHIEGAEEQLTREPISLPKLEIKDRNGVFSIFNWQYEDFELSNYKYHPKINFGGVTV